MFARVLAAFCLFNLVVAACWATSDGPANSELVVYLRTDSLQPPRPVDIMKHELASLMLSAGYRVEWHTPQNKGDTTAGTLVVVELRGACSMPAGSFGPDIAAADTRTLASTAVSDDTVLPFSTVNCAGLTRLLAPMLAPEGGARRDFLYGRAMARLLAHEFYHILANTRDHDRDGIAKPHFTFTDLLTEQFEFEHTTLAKMQRQPVDSVAETQSGADLPTGR
ncbi:conserved exported hypothetical protein [Candidatus Sulfopaludibacter sp. SbA3]|nr:conserved exported hypothetical protein [Candidatus Sulfopaludibacter sp. SbA3]